MGAGVKEDRRFAAGVSDVVLSAPGAKALETRDIFECAAVARMAFKRSALFCWRFGASEELRTLRFNEEIAASSALVSSSDVLFRAFSSCTDGSMIGHTNPVRGV